MRIRYSTRSSWLGSGVLLPYPVSTACRYPIHRRLNSLGASSLAFLSYASKCGASPTLFE
ncbi:hypothetical protein I7I53_03106 [Histoplasma capsulatum var. duboisii H88]|uniref:Uncharacterized protein n=1 Tax=Ajellomyces capsulatus (strain H88) TaxID=544711 RepID=A0A8A1LMT3_AJEC8|nr:hypothetical protein I7I53_03106 [Histoplasma capsulatum var. duboisii H88]